MFHQLNQQGQDVYILLCIISLMNMWLKWLIPKLTILLSLDKINWIRGRWKTCSLMAIWGLLYPWCMWHVRNISLWIVSLSGFCEKTIGVPLSKLVVCIEGWLRNFLRKTFSITNNPSTLATAQSFTLQKINGIRCANVLSNRFYISLNFTLFTRFSINLCRHTGGRLHVLGHCNQMLHSVDWGPFNFAWPNSLFQSCNFKGQWGGFITC